MIAYKRTWTWQQREHLKRETVSLLIEAQSSTINIDYIKAKIDNIQHSKSSLRGKRNETINYVACEWSKLVQKSIRHGTTGLVWFV